MIEEARFVNAEIAGHSYIIFITLIKTLTLSLVTGECHFIKLHFILPTGLVSSELAHECTHRPRDHLLRLGSRMTTRKLTTRVATAHYSYNYAAKNFSEEERAF